MELLQNLVETLVEGYRALIDLLSPLIASLAGVFGISLSPEQSQIATTLLLTLVGAWIVGRAVTRLSVRSKSKPAAFAQRTNALVQSLARTSVEADTLLKEMTSVITARDAAVEQLEHQLTELAAREEDLKTRIETLSTVPIPAVQHFISLQERAERRSAFRDWIIFALGAVISTILTIATLSFSH
jgi:hypothetical protein